MGMCEWGTCPFYDTAVDCTIRMSNQNKTKTVHAIAFVVEATSCLSSAAAAFVVEPSWADANLSSAAAAAIRSKKHIVPVHAIHVNGKASLSCNDEPLATMSFHAESGY